MKLLLFFIFFSGSLSGQNISIVSKEDSLGIPFVNLKIEYQNQLIQRISDQNGVIVLGFNIDDTIKYFLTFKSIDYQNYKLIMKGFEFKQLKKVSLFSTEKEIDQVVITAQYSSIKVENAIMKIKVIDRKTMDLMGATNLKDVLVNQMNIRVEQDNILGSGMSCQGVGGENVKILLDGVPIIGRLNGNIDLSQINISTIERIEILEGPLSVQYGTNALAGTINLISKKSINKLFEIINENYYQSNGTYNLFLGTNFSNKKSQFQLSGFRNYFDGWNFKEEFVLIPKKTMADSLRFKQWKPREQYSIDFGYKYSTNRYQVTYKTTFFTEKILNRGLPIGPYAETSFDDRYYTKRWDNSISFNAKINSNWKVVALAAYNSYSRVKSKSFIDLTNLNEVITSNDGDQDTSTFKAALTRVSFIRFKDSTKINYELGIDFNHEFAVGKRIENQLQSMGDYAAFSTIEYKPFSNLETKVGLRYAYNTVYTSPIIPSIQIKWNLATNNTLRISYSRGFRAPSIKELYFYFVDLNHNIVGNQNLKAEFSTNFMLSYSLIKTFKKLNYKLDVSSFYNGITNLITLAQLNFPQYTYVNIGEYSTVGLQVSNQFSWKNFNSQFGASYIGRENINASSSLVPFFSYSPEIQTNLTYNQKKIKLSYSLFYKFNGPLPNFQLVNSEVVQFNTQGYHILDLSIDKRFPKDLFSVTFGIKNCLNVTNINANLSNAAHSSGSGQLSVATGRNLFLKIKINLKKSK